MVTYRQKHSLVQFVAAEQSLAGLEIQRPRAVFGFQSIHNESSQEPEELDEDEASSMDESSE